MSSFGAGYHVFCFNIDGEWHRTRDILDDTAFDALMNKLDWGMPYNMKAFHFTSSEQPPHCVNPVFQSHPMIEVDIENLFEKRNGIKLERKGENPVAVLHFEGVFAIVETDDGYGRLLRYTDSGGELSYEEYYPLSFAQAKAFVDKHHRHNSAPQSHKFSIGLLHLGKLVGVIIASTPKARALNDGFTLELNRCCVLPDQRNACSKLYAKAILAGRSMGYRRFVTYTLAHEPGSSLKAVRFKPDGVTQARPNGWDSPSRRRPMPERYPTEAKIRWILKV